MEFKRDSPLKAFTFEQYKEIIAQETKGTVEDKVVQDLWNTYKEKDYSIQMIINKANADQREETKINKHRTVVLLGSKDHTYTDKETKDTDNPTAGNVFQSFVTAWDFDQNAFVKLSIKGTPRLKAKNIEWGKKCKVGTKTYQSKGYDNEDLVKVEEYINDPTFNLEELFKSICIAPEHLTKAIVDKHGYVCLYGEIGKISQIKTKITKKDDETGRIMVEPYYEPPYFRTLDDSGNYVPCFQFGLSSPQEETQNERKYIKVRFRTQYFGRSVLLLDGWTDASAKAIAQLDKKEAEVDNSAIEEEMNAMFGNGACKVFVIGSLGVWSIYNEVAYINVNATYVVQTKYKPTKPLTKEESHARLEGKPIEKDPKAEVERLKSMITRGMQINNIDTVTYETLKEMGTFDDFDFNEAIVKRMVEKIRSELKTKKTEKKDDGKDQSKMEEKPKSDDNPKTEVKSESKKEELKLELTAKDLSAIAEQTNSIKEMLTDFGTDELMTMLKDSIRKAIGDNKFGLWKSQFYEKTVNELNQLKSQKKDDPKPEIKPEIKKDAKKDDPEDAQYVDIMQTLKEVNASDECKKIVEYIYKSDTSHTGVAKKDIITQFRSTMPLDKINESLTSLLKTYAVITESQKNCYSVV